MSSPDNQPLESRLEALRRNLPLPLLLVGTALAWGSVDTGYGSWRRYDHGLVVVALAAAWTIAVTMRNAHHGPRARVAGYVVHVALAGILVGVNPWFALFAFTGYVLAPVLPGWQRLGLVATACVMAASQIGGYPFSGSRVVWLGYLAIIVVNTVIVLIVFNATSRVIEQNLERGHIIGELNEANARLESAIAENAGLHAQLVQQAREAGVQDERQRMAGEIHDTLAQGLAGIVTQLEAAEHSAEGAHHLAQARALARSSLNEARRSVRALRPEQLEAASLVQALDELARASAVPVVSESTGSVRRLPVDVESALFRVAQEGLTNVAKHARASKVWVTLTYLDDVVLLDLRDDGVGCSPSSASGYGLDAMRQRLARVGGRLEIETGPGEGTVISASIPCGAR